MANTDQGGSNSPYGPEERVIVPVARRQMDYALAPAPDVLGSAQPAVSLGSSYLFKRILQHKWTIFVVAMAVIVPCLALVWLALKPEYNAEGQINIQPVIEPLIIDAGRGGGERSIPYYHEFVFTQVALIKSPTILNRVLDSNDLKSTQWYQKIRAGGRLPTIDMLKELLTVQPFGRTTMITVSAKMNYGPDAVSIVKVVLDKYITYAHESEEEDLASAYQQLLLERDNLGAGINEAERQIDVLRTELGTGDPEQLVAEQRKRVDEMQAKMDELGRTIKLARFDVDQGRSRLGMPSLEDAPLTAQPAADDAAVRNAASMPASGLAAGGDPTLMYANDMPWRTYYTELQNLQQEFTLKSRSLGQAHPDMITLRDRIRLTKANMETRQIQLDRGVGAVSTGMSLAHSAGEAFIPGGSMAGDVQLKQQTLRRLEFERKLLDDDLKKQQTNSSDSFGRAQTLRTQLRDLAFKRQQYEQVRNSLERRRQEMHMPASITISSPPYLPDNPVVNRRVALSAVVLIFGLACGVGVAFLRVKANPNIQEVQELTQSTPVPFLGQLPLVRGHDRHALLDDVLLSEGVRMVRTPLLQRIDRIASDSLDSPSKQGSVVLITSPGPGDGKSTLSILLARSLANCGRRVLLVDADLRNPSLAAVLNIDNQHGLMDILCGKGNDQNYIVRTEVERLSVLPTGNVAGRGDPELIADGKFCAAMTRWRANYDVILLDSPPVLPVADARIMSCSADGAILVVRARQNQREDVIDAIHHLESAGGQLWGTVLVGAGAGTMGIPPSTLMAMAPGPDMEKCVPAVQRGSHRLIQPMRKLALEALARMYLPQARRFVHCIRRTAGGDNPEGVSRRYTAITLLALAAESAADAATILAGDSPAAVCDSLLDDVDAMQDLGEVALTLWAARTLGLSRASVALRRMKEQDPVGAAWPTVEISWCLTALCAVVRWRPVRVRQAPGGCHRQSAPGDAASQFRFVRPLACRRRPSLAARPCAVLCGPRLSRAGPVVLQPDERFRAALAAAKRCAKRMCALQGKEGQWWWHYDVRTGKVVERYPVYAVHQDAMGPMALLALEQAGGGDYTEAINRSLDWLEFAPEINGSLFDTKAGLIWRKVCRREPGKLSRGLGAFSSKMASWLRVPGLNMLFPPRCVDWESRPYHMAWLLHAFGPQA